MTGRRAGRAGLAMLLLGVAFLALIPADARPVALLANRHLAARTSATATSRPPQQRAAAPVGGQLLRRFQRPATPYGRGHRGVDLAADPGEPVRAALAGTVAFAGPVAGVPWVTVAHDDGLDTTYGGLEPAVRVGERVRVGGVLGHATAAGRIDWGARHRARYVDPLGLLGGWVVRLVPVEPAS